MKIHNPRQRFTVGRTVLCVILLLLTQMPGRTDAPVPGAGALRASKKAQADFSVRFGPSGGYGYLIVTQLSSGRKWIFKASNVTETRDGGNRTVEQSNRPCPPGKFALEPKYNLHDRPGVHVDNPYRPGIFVHSTKPGTAFGWFLTQGCIRVQPATVTKLKQLFGSQQPTIVVKDSEEPNTSQTPKWASSDTRAAYRPIRSGQQSKVDEFLLAKDARRFKDSPQYGWIVSPDEEYVVELPGESYAVQSDEGYIKAFRWSKANRMPATSKPEFHQNLYRTRVSGFYWVKPHAFIYAARWGVKDKTQAKPTESPRLGTPFIGYWSPETGFRLIKMGKLLPNQDPDAVFFRLNATTKDGKNLYFEDYGGGKVTLVGDGKLNKEGLETPLSEAALP